MYDLRRHDQRWTRTDRGRTSPRTVTNDDRSIRLQRERREKILISLSFWEHRRSAILSLPVYDDDDDDDDDDRKTRIARLSGKKEEVELTCESKTFVMSVSLNHACFSNAFFSFGRSAFFSFLSLLQFLIRKTCFSFVHEAKDMKSISVARCVSRATQENHFRTEEVETFTPWISRELARHFSLHTRSCWNSATEQRTVSLVSLSTIACLGVSSREFTAHSLDQSQ